MSIDPNLMLLLFIANRDAEHQYFILAVTLNETFKMQWFNL